MHGTAQLFSFLAAVTALHGQEQAQASTEDWFEESELMDSPPPSTAGDWRAITVAASARLAGRIDAAQYRQKSLTDSTHTKLSPRPPSANCFTSKPSGGRARSA